MEATDRTALQSEIERIDFRAVARVAQRVRLLAVRLGWSQVGRFADFERIPDDWPERAFVRFDAVASVDVEDREPVGSPFGVQCSFVLHFFLDADARESTEVPDAGPENPPAVAVEAVFELIYEISDHEGVEPDDFRHFALANGTHNAWPYWREFAQSSTVRLGLAPYVAPPFKLPSSDDPEQKASPAESKSPSAGAGEVASKE